MPEPRTGNKSPALPLLVAGLAAVALLAAIFGLPGEDAGEGRGSAATTGSSEPRTEVATEDPLAQLARRRADDPTAKGDVDAPVVMIAYSDFQCPFCGKFARDTFPVLEEKYVANGTLRVEWRDFPYLGAESMTAALAARAAAEQGRFWDFHDALYADQLPPNSGKLDQAYVEGVARDLGLDVEKLRADMESDTVRSRVQADFQEGQAIGVNGTPSFLVNGTPVVGAQPTSVFEQVIEEAAAGS